MKINEIVTEGLGDLAAQFAGGLAGKSASQVKYEKDDYEAQKAERKEASAEEKEAKSRGMTVQQLRAFKKAQADKAQAAQKEIEDKKKADADMRAKLKAQRQAMRSQRGRV